MPINNGPIYNKMAQEYLVWVDGQPITWASTEAIGWKIYNEAKRVREDHARKNPDEQPAWEWSTQTAPNKEEVVEVLDFIALRVCSWCNKVIGTVESLNGTTHGICAECLEVELAKI